MAKLRLLIIAPRFGSIGRGVEVFVREFVRNLDTDSHEVTILSGPHSQNANGSYFVMRNLLCREKTMAGLWQLLSRLPARLYLGSTDIESLTLMLHSNAFLRESNFDIIMPFGGAWTYRFANYHKKSARIIAVGHAGPVLSELKHSDFFVAVTPTDADLVQDICPDIPTKVIPNGVDTFRFIEPVLREVKSEKVILCAAALTEGKGHRFLFDAVWKLDSTTRLLCAGRGPLKDALTHHPLTQAGRVEFVEVSPDQMPYLYQTADAFSLASPMETFGLVFLEALACGLPVVAHDGPRQRFVVGETGFFCDVHDPCSYADALRHALQSPQNMRRRAHAETFQWNRVMMEYHKVFESLVS